MVKLLLKCIDCKTYTFRSISEEDSIIERRTCPNCQGTLKTPHPPKFSMENKYSHYIRTLKKELET